MKILWGGNIFNPCGIATAGREMVKALVALGHQVQVKDPWTSKYEFNEGLKDLNNAIDIKDVDATVFFDYPMHWREGHGKIIGGAVHEGTRLWEGWADCMNKADVVWCPSEATKNLFKWNGVNRPIHVIPHGVSNIYIPNNSVDKNTGDFVFLSINSWGGEIGDRKGTDLLIKAFDEEFKDVKDVKLLLKVSTFWKQKFDVRQKILELLGHPNENILLNAGYEEEKQLVTFYQNSNVFVAPTKGEGFGMTILNSLACGLPVIVTKDRNSGHMDYCQGNPAVLFVKSTKMSQGDPQFYTQGNLLSEPDFDDLKRQMRYAYEHRKEINELGMSQSQALRDKWTWEASAKKLVEVIKNG